MFIVIITGYFVHDDYFTDSDSKIAKNKLVDLHKQNFSIKDLRIITLHLETKIINESNIHRLGLSQDVCI